MQRALEILAAVVGSGLVGTAGAFLVWNFIYSIGALVVEDETYARLHGDVVNAGGLAGAMLAVWVAMVLRRANPGFLLVAHMVAIILGFISGSADWKLGLWGYFGGLGLFAVVAIFRGRRLGKAGSAGRADGGAEDGGWIGGDSGGDGGGDGGGGGGD